MEDKQDEFLTRDKLAHLVFEKLFDRLISKYEIADDDKKNSFIDKKCENWLKERLERMSIVSYQAADAMRKARLGAFK